MPHKEDLLENVAELPARALERGAVGISLFGRFLGHLRPIKGAKNTWKSLGPGLVTGAADDDPSGIATYSQAGAQYGFSFLWLSLYTFPLMAVIQEMCARIALVTRKGLAQNIRAHYSRKILYGVVVLLALANIINIGADFAAMAAASRLIIPTISQNTFVVFYGLLILLLEIYLSYRVYARYLKWLALVTLSYVFAAIFAKVPWKELLMQTLRPTLSWTRESLMLITGVLGTTISPYLFFWQTAQEVEEEETHKHTALIPKKEVRAMRMDVWSGMFLSNFVMFAIIATAGYALHAHGITNITTADQAAQALRPFAGDFAYILFALGIIGTGMLAIPVLAGSLSYALAETFGWKQGLNKKLHQARAFYGSLILAVVLGLVMNFFHIDPIAALIGSAVLNGLIAPIMLVFVLGIASRKSIMGPLANTKFANAIGWLLTLLMSGAAVGTIISIL